MRKELLKRYTFSNTDFSEIEMVEDMEGNSSKFEKTGGNERWGFMEAKKQVSKVFDLIAEEQNFIIS